MIFLFYLQEEYGRQELSKAISYLERAVKEGHEFAQYALGRLLIDPSSGAFEPKRGMELLRAAAEQGNTFAKLTLGIVYIKGEIVDKDREKGMAFLQEASEEGNPFAPDMIRNMELWEKQQKWRMVDRGIKAAVRIWKSDRFYKEQEMKKACYYLKRSMQKECAQWINQEEYHQLQIKIQCKEHEKEIDMEQEQ